MNISANIYPQGPNIDTTVACDDGGCGSPMPNSLRYLSEFLIFFLAILVICVRPLHKGGLGTRLDKQPNLPGHPGSPA